MNHGKEDTEKKCSDHTQGTDTTSMKIGPKGLRENIGRVGGAGYMRNRNTAVAYFVTYMMYLNVDVLRSIVHNRMLSHPNGCLIVREDLDGPRERTANFLEKLPQPEGFAYCGRCCNIFSFG